MQAFFRNYSRFFSLLLVIVAVMAIAFALYTLNRSHVPTTDKSIDQKLGTLGNTEQNPFSSATSTIPEAELSAAVATVKLPKGCVLSATLTETAQVYQVTVVNKGASACKNVSYTMYYSPGETYLSALPKPTASNYYWRVGNLAAQQNYKGAAITVSGMNSNTELCAAADNGADSCVDVTTAPPVAQTPTPSPVSTTTSDTGGTSGSAQGSGGEYGVWVWDSAYAMTPSRRTQVIQDAKAAGFNVIYLTIDDYLTTPDSTKAAYSSALSSFIGEANAAGIQVDAEGGWRDWAQTTNRSKGYTLISYAASFNTTYPNKLRGFQYDVEPYLLPEYETNKAAVLTDFVSFIDESVTKFGSSNLRFSVVIPHFYDDQQNWTPNVSYNGTTAATYTHLLSILDKRPNSSIIVMAYRNFTDGTDGSVQLSKVEVSEANGHATKVVVAQETGNVEPSYVTFYGTSRASLTTAITQIKSALGGNSGFGGIAVHYIDPFEALK